MRPADVWSLSRAELSALLARGFPIEPDALAGSSFRGVSLGLPRVVERLTWKEFRKEMFRDAQTGRVVGRNVRVHGRASLRALEDGESPPAARLRGGEVEAFGPFGVRALTERGYPCSAGVVLDYGLAHPRLHPMAIVRDPLVALREGSTALLLGASYVSLGGRLLATPSFFTLEREPPAAR